MVDVDLARGRPSPRSSRSRAWSSARSRSILPCRIRRRYETSSSSFVSSSISCLRSSSESEREIGKRFHVSLSSAGGSAPSQAEGDPRVNLSLRLRPLASVPSVSHDLLDQLAQLGLELDRQLLGLALGVDVDERLVRVGQHLRPAALVEDLDPVEQVDLAVAQALGERRASPCPSATTGTGPAGGRACSPAARRRAPRAAARPARAARAACRGSPRRRRPAGTPGRRSRRRRRRRRSRRRRPRPWSARRARPACGSPRARCPRRARRPGSSR